MKSFFRVESFLFAFVLFISLIFSSCTRTDNFPAGTHIFSDGEQLDKKGEKFLATNDSSFFFDGGKQQSSVEAHSGKYSALTLPKKGAFAFGHTIKNAGPDWYFVISVWRKSKDGKGVLVASSKKAKLLYLATGNPVVKDENGWEKLEMELFTPPHFGYGDLGIYVWNNGSDSVFFDDISIERKQKKIFPVFEDQPLTIILDTSDFLKIIKKRKNAFETGILQSADNDWVKGIIVSENEIMKSKLRLKGDWLDHLNGEKWSYRIKMRKSFSWNRLRTFSIQTPYARDFLREWEAHQFFRDKDILTTRYGFVPVYLNSESKGIYAWEEHFDKQLLEWSYRREGPILKFTEDAFWHMQRINLEFTDTWRTIPFYEAALIKPFKESKTVESPNLYNQFLNGQKLLYQYKHALATPDEIFDLKKLAAYYAMLDLMKISHGKAWHNQRFYFNPVICKLEPIAFDGYSGHSNFFEGIKANTAYQTFNNTNPIPTIQLLFTNLFTDSVFIASYIQSLEEYSDESYIRDLKSSYRQELVHYDSLLKKEFKYYEYDNDFLFENAKEIREYLPELRGLIEEKLFNLSFTFNLKADNYVDTTVFSGTPELLVNAYVEKRYSDRLTLRIDNFNTSEILVLGTSSKGKKVNYFFHPEPKIEAFNGNGNKTEYAISDTNANYLFFMIKDHFETYKVPIHKWPFPEGKTAQQELMEFAVLENNPLIEKIDGKDIYIQGSHKTNIPFIIPTGYKVHFMSGTTLDLVEGAMFISYSPISMNGTKDEPILIQSSDFSANGFTILQAGEESNLEYVNFENLNTLDFKGWTITGAVTFYESDVTISHSRFYRNHCEDALNTIRSKFTVIDSEFEYIFSDAFDSDFCTGEVINTKFSNVGNDAIDFSGSQIFINEVLIEDVNDKGISGGEESTLVVENSIIKRAGIGLASKDLSLVEFANGELIDCNYGLVLLQKKPEYGPAKVIFNNSKIVKPEIEMLIEMGSVVEKDGKTIKGKKEKLADIFYQ